MNEIWDKIQALKLETVRKKLGERKGWWWRLTTDASKLEKEYRQFLYLIAQNPEKPMIPWSQNLDDFWHEHILDTQKYAQDCQAIFGKFIHHDPHLPKGSKTHNESFDATRKAYKDNFGKSSSSDSAACSAIAVFCSSFCDSHDSHGHDSGCSGHSCNSCSSSCGGGGD